MIICPLISALALLACSLPLAAAPPPIKPLDAGLKEFAYPYDVLTRTFTDQGKSLELAYMDVRPEQANGKSVLLLHGKNFSGAYWQPTAEALGREGFRVIIPDMIGFGRSSKPLDYQYSFHAYGRHLDDLLDQLGIERVNIVGHSMGGMVATRFALMFPASVEKLILVNPIGLEDWKRFVPYATVDETYAVEAKKTPETIRDYMTKAYFDGQWKDAYDPLLALQAGWAIGPDRELIARVSALTSDMVFTQPVVHEFSDLKSPALLIIGERDRTAIGKERATPEVAKQLGQYQNLGKAAKAAIPNAELVALPGLGHLPQYEDFDSYWKALDSFLTKP